MNTRFVLLLTLTLVVLTPTTDHAAEYTWAIEVAQDNLSSWFSFQIATNPGTGALGLVYQEQVGKKFVLRFKERSETGTWGATETIASSNRFDYWDAFTYNPLTFEPTIAYGTWRTGDLTFARRGNGNWPGEILGTDDSYHLDMAIDSSGTTWVAYCADGKSSQAMKVTHLSGTVWEVPGETLFPECAHPGLAAGREGELGLFFMTDSDGDSLQDMVHYSYRELNGDWTTEAVAGPPQAQYAGLGLAFGSDGTATLLIQERFTDSREVWLVQRTEQGWVKKAMPLPGGVTQWQAFQCEGPYFTDTGELQVLVGRLDGVQLAHCSIGESVDCIYEWIIQESFDGNLTAAFAPESELPYVAIQKHFGDWQDTIWLAVPAACESAEVSCTDGIDNDCDGNIDCDDGACDFDEACIPTPIELVCDDAIDNDGDGSTDCEDNDCIDDSSCQQSLSCSDYPDKGSCSADSDCRWHKKKRICLDR